MDCKRVNLVHNTLLMLVAFSSIVLAHINNGNLIRTHRFPWAAFGVKSIQKYWQAIQRFCPSHVASPDPGCCLGWCCGATFCVYAIDDDLLLVLQWRGHDLNGGNNRKFKLLCWSRGLFRWSSSVLYYNAGHAKALIPLVVGGSVAENFDSSHVKNPSQLINWNMLCQLAI